MNKTVTNCLCGACDVTTLSKGRRRKMEHLKNVNIGSWVTTYVHCTHSIQEDGTEKRANLVMFTDVICHHKIYTSALSIPTSMNRTTHTHKKNYGLFDDNNTTVFFLWCSLIRVNEWTIYTKYNVVLIVFILRQRAILRTYLWHCSYFFLSSLCRSVLVYICRLRVRNNHLDESPIRIPSIFTTFFL